MKAATKKIHDLVDEYIGSGGLPSDVLDFVYDAMNATAVHLVENCQDHEAAKHWGRMATFVDKLADKLGKAGM